MKEKLYTNPLIGWETWDEQCPYAIGVQNGRRQILQGTEAKVRSAG